MAITQNDYLLNEAELGKITGDGRKSAYVYNWLQNLLKLLLETRKDDIKDTQKILVDQLMRQLMNGSITAGHPTRKLIAKCLATIFTIGDTFLLFETINKCIDSLKNRDDSAAIVAAKLSSIVCIGIMYESLGRLMGRTYEETVQILLKYLKNSESQTRFEIYSTLRMIIAGMGTAASSVYRDVYKALKHGMADRAMPVRANAAKCLRYLIEVAPFLYTSEIENVFSLCFRALDGSNYEVRCAVAQTIGHLAAITQNAAIRQCVSHYQSSSIASALSSSSASSVLPSASSSASNAAASSSKIRLITLDEALNLLAAGYLRGGIGFLKAGEMIKGSSTVNREIRLGVSHAYVAFVERMGSAWAEKNITPLLSHLFEMLTNAKSASTHLDAIHSRRCVAFILRSIIGKVLTEIGRFQALKELVRLFALYSRVGVNLGGGGDLFSGTDHHRTANQANLLSEISTAPRDLDSRGSKISGTASPPITTDIQMAQHVLVVAAIELGTLVHQLGASCQSLLPLDTMPQFSMIDAVSQATVHPCHVVRLAACWCLRRICTSICGQLTPQLERSLERLEQYRSSCDAINGYSYAISALLGAVRHTPLGVPQRNAKMIFNVAEDLLRSASQNSRLSMPRTQAGWQLMGAICSLGHCAARGLAPRLLLLWKNSFPRNTRELDSEKARGDAFTWQITLENRSGALAAMACFLECCPKLVTDDVRRRLLTPIESAITMLVSLNSLFKSLGAAIKASCTMVRLRLYQVLLLLPPQLYENCFANLLRLLVSDLTLTENVANATSSVLRDLMQTNADIVLGSWIQETEHHLIEDQISLFLSSGVGSIEYDPTILYRSNNDLAVYPSAPPLAVMIINQAAAVFAAVFPYVAQKHRVQMLNHFGECVKHAKSARQEAIQINILTALLGALKTLAESKMNLGTDEVRRLAVAHITASLNHANPLIRYASAECIGRCVQIVNDGRFLSETTQQCFERLRTARDALTRTGYSLAIGSIHHYVVGMGSVPQLKTNISLLLALAEDHSSPSVQIWALHALTLIAESGGPMFRPYVEPTLDQCLKILFPLPPSLIDVYQSIGKCLSALITTIGPEFQSSTHAINEIRISMLSACRVLQEHGDFLVKSETIGCLQQLHIFDRRNVDLHELVFVLCDAALQSHYLLRKASISCMHQVAQKESKLLIEFGAQWIHQQQQQQQQQPPQQQPQQKSATNNCVAYGVISNFAARAATGLPGILIALLDFETDNLNVSNIKKILTCLIQFVDEYNLGLWLRLCKEVLSGSDTANSSSNIDRASLTLNSGTAGSATLVSGAASSASAPEHDTEDGEFEDSDFKAIEDRSSQTKLSYRGDTRAFVMSLLSKIIINCGRCAASSSSASSSASSTGAHFDLIAARDRHTQSSGRQDFLILHLSDLVRMSFIGATSESDDLRLAGLRTLELVIEKFARVPEPEFANHVILEQYQAQVGAALRPAFAADTPSHVTAMACQVCSAWIGSGVARDLNDLRRVHSLLVSSLDKLRKNCTSRLYNESASTMEKLAILRAWAEVYAVAMATCGGDDSSASAPDDESNSVATTSKENLLHLVTPELLTLSKYWICALRDHALLTLPAEFTSTVAAPDFGGTFFIAETIESVRPMYRSAWPPLLNAAALWLCSGRGFEIVDRDPIHNMSKFDQFYLLFGVCMEALSNPKSSESASHVSTYLASLGELFAAKNDVTKSIFATGDDRRLIRELCQVLHRLLFTHEVSDCQLRITEIIKSIVAIEAERLQEERFKRSRVDDVLPVRQSSRNNSTSDSSTANEDRNRDIDAETNQSNSNDQIEEAQIGEGGTSGEFARQESVVYSLLEICLSILVRQLPQLCPTLAAAPEFSFIHRSSSVRQQISHNTLTTTTTTSTTSAAANLVLLNGDNARLVANVISILTDLPALCSPTGAITIFPTILYLLTGVFCELSIVPQTIYDEKLYEKEPIRTFLRCVRTLCTLPLFAAANDSAGDAHDARQQWRREWIRLLQSAVARILDMSKTSNDEHKQDFISTLLAIGVFAIHSPADVLYTAQLQYPIINLMTQALRSDNDLIQLKCIETLRSIFAQSDRRNSLFYAQTLAPKIIELYYTMLGAMRSGAARDGSAVKVDSMLAILSCLELFVEKAANDKKINMLSIYIPALISLLHNVDSELMPQQQQQQQQLHKPQAAQSNLRLLSNSSAHRAQLHEYALRRLTEIGLKYSAQFRQIMSSNTQYSECLKSAIRNQQIKAQNATTADAADRAARNSQRSAASISLKVDFSNYK